MMNNQQDMVRKAKKKLLNNVLKINNTTRAFLFFLAILSTYIYKEILLQHNDWLILDRKNTGIILIPFFIFWGLFYLLARQINKINNSRWRFWVLKNIHYLQYFVEIKKFAERRNYINTTENFLDKEYIIRKSKKSEHKKLLDKLEIFEYAFTRNLEDNLSQTLIYKANKWNAFLFILWSLLWFGGFILGGILQIRDYNYKYGDFHFNASLIFISFISILPLGILLRWVSFLFIKNALLKVNLEGVNIKGFEKGQLISWEYIHKVEYIKETVGKDTIHYLYFRFKYVQYPNKFKKKEFKIATSNLKLRGDIIYQQVNAMHQKYLKEEGKKINFKLKIHQLYR